MVRNLFWSNFRKKILLKLSNKKLFYNDLNRFEKLIPKHKPEFSQTSSQLKFMQAVKTSCNIIYNLPPKKFFEETRKRQL